MGMLDSLQNYIESNNISDLDKEYQADPDAFRQKYIGAITSQPATNGTAGTKTQILPSIPTDNMPNRRNPSPTPAPVATPPQLSQQNSNPFNAVSQHYLDDDKKQEMGT